MSVRLFLLLIVSLFAIAKCQVRYCEKICPTNEVFSYNATQCQNTCFDPTYSQSKNCRVGPACICKNGYIRNQDTYQCVPVSSCTDKRSSKGCPMNEFYSDCDAGCQKTCSSIYSAVQCQCSSGCICRTGYFRSDINHQCQTARECQSIIQKPIPKQISDILILQVVHWVILTMWLPEHAFSTVSRARKMKPTKVAQVVKKHVQVRLTVCALTIVVKVTLVDRD